jgi:hypothetical protein
LEAWDRQHDSLHRRKCDRNHILHHAENDNVEEHGGGLMMIIDVAEK